ncbi:MAG: hypothetical protein LBF51_06565, partial [Zoogloeaceae bacterium]|nr:hypothetical protein [Zoogloeaceae bacterium]
MSSGTPLLSRALIASLVILSCALAPPALAADSFTYDGSSPALQNAPSPFSGASNTLAPLDYTSTSGNIITIDYTSGTDP